MTSATPALSDAPALSVAMSVYNNAPYLDLAIHSIVQQSFGDFEFLIVNDGSTDGSAEIIDAWAAKDARIRAIHQPNKGFIASLNRLFDEARAPWIARMDGDDVSHPERFARQLAFLNANPGHGVISCSARLVGPDGKQLAKERVDRPHDHDGIVADMGNGIAINHNAAIMPRDIVRAIGGYRPAYRHCEDYDIWLRLSEHTRFANIDEELVDYRIYPEQVSNRHLVEQARNAAIAWMAHGERVAGRADPTDGLSQLPPLSEIDALFGKSGVASFVRRKVVGRMLFSPEALSGDGFGLLLDYIREEGSEPRIWRAAARLMKAGHPGKAASVAGALLRA